MGLSQYLKFQTSKSIFSHTFSQSYGHSYLAVIFFWKIRREWLAQFLIKAFKFKILTIFVGVGDFPRSQKQKIMGSNPVAAYPERRALRTRLAVSMQTLLMDSAE
jgi:hypothetical protein